jgi:peptidoglycan hydrolase-like protein with peptidoglycan-binding domain
VNIFAHRAKGRLALSLAFVIFLITLLSATTAFAKTENQQPTNQNTAGSAFGALSQALVSHQDARVTVLQRELAGKGVSPGPIDGFYGPRTERAVANYQHAQGLAVDGIAGVKTFTALRYGGAKQTQDLQANLSQLGFNPGAADGLYGPKTAEAVSAFQQRNQLTVDGFAGPQTLSAIARLSTKPNPSVSLHVPGPVAGAPQALAMPKTPQVPQGRYTLWAALAVACGAAMLALFRYFSLRRRYEALAYRFVDLAKASDWTLNWEKRFGFDEEGSEATVALLGAKNGSGTRHMPSCTDVKRGV